MERALDPALLGRALGGRESFPSPEELASAIGQAELALLAGGGEVNEDLLRIGWYLHGVAAVRGAPELYGIDRQRAAARVAAHVLDLSLRTPTLDDGTVGEAMAEEAGADATMTGRLRRCVAAQVSYLRSGLDPNALALYRRERNDAWLDVGMFDAGDRPALFVGAALFGGDIGWVFDYSNRLIAEARRVAARWELETLEGTPHSPPLDVVLAARDLVVHLVYGREGAMERCRGRLEALLSRADAVFFPDARWVAALILDLMTGLDAASVRAVLPPDVPEGVRRAFTIASPPIVTLWPPQVDLLGTRNGPSALDPSVRRLLISAPTSAGKTLTAQLLIASYLATEDRGVCYVAPTRSLCREVQGALLQRLRFIARGVSAELPEWFLPDGLASAAAVEVMTPERLAFLLRSEGRGVLDRFGMFVFDEVHTIGDASRGWTLESDLAFIHEAASETDHRIVLISAAVSNRAHFRSWLQSGGAEPVDFHSDWRGPRRLHALWTTEADWDRTETVEKRQANSPDREATPLVGTLVARDPGTGDHLTWRMADVGTLVLRPVPGSRRKTKDTTSTPAYRMLVPLVKHLAGMGPVLVIEATRERAALLATALAEDPNPDWVGDRILIDAASTLLGNDHTLTRAVRSGVGYHHGSLPVEIRAQVEDAVTAGALRVLVSTTTLTEGVNLPVRSVVVAERGAYGSDEYQEFITGAKLLNAVGRAGRAAKETEGVIVIALRGNEAPEFGLFEPDDEALSVRSPLATPDALAGLAALEDAARASVDAVYEADGAPSGFISFVWFVASELERHGDEVTIERVEQTLQRSLGWVQLDAGGRGVWVRAADAVVTAYLAAPAGRRQAWASAGTAVGSARLLETLAAEVAVAIAPEARTLPTETLLRAVLDGGRLERLLALPEAPDARVLSRLATVGDPSGVRVLLDIASDWVRGLPLREIAEARLAHVAARRRLEWLVDLTSKYFELFLPWALSTVVRQANEALAGAVREGDEPPVRFPDRLAAVVRWGVDRDTALRLILRGVVSRRLAMAVAAEWDEIPALFGDTVFEWLGTMRVQDWVESFGATPAELRNLLLVVRPEGEGIASELLGGAPFAVEFESEVGSLAEMGATLALDAEAGRTEAIAVWAGGRRIGVLPGRHHGDVAGFIRGGLALQATVSADDVAARVVLRLVEP